MTEVIARVHSVHLEQ